MRLHLNRISRISTDRSWCLFVLDEAAATTLVAGQRPRPLFSHGLNLLSLAQEALRLGQRVGFLAPDLSGVLEVGALYPAVTRRREYRLAELGPGPFTLFAVSPADLSRHAARLPPRARRRGVLMVPAIHWLEAPERFQRDYLDELREAAVYDIDAAICQNQAMADLFAALAMLAGSLPRARVHVAPCGYLPEEEPGLAALGAQRAEIRREMGLAGPEIVLINAGGMWRWTDFDVFLEAFIALHRARPGNRLVFQIMGLRQDGNADHQAFIARLQALIAANRDLVDCGALRVIEDWQKAGARLGRYLHGADLGVNVSKRSIEQAQSFRQRVVDYIRAGLPVINTEGDPLSLGPFRAMMLCVEAGSPAAYRALFDQLLDGGEAALAPLRQQAQALRQQLRTDRNYAPLLTRLLAEPPRPAAERGALIDWYTDAPGFQAIRARRDATTPPAARPLPRLYTWLRALWTERPARLRRELERRHPELATLDDAAFIDAAYRHFLHRAPDPAGLIHYLDQLCRRPSRARVIRDIIVSKERRNLLRRPGV